MMKPICCIAAALAIAGCSPSDVLSVPAPTGVLPGSALETQSGAEQLEGTGEASLAQGFGQGPHTGVLLWGGVLGDEFTLSELANYGSYASVDARTNQGTHGFGEPADASIQALMGARLTLLSAISLLERYEPPSGRSKIGLGFALLGYTELLAAEDFCDGLPLATLTSSGVTYGVPLTGDALLGVAEAHFDSAVAYANNDAVAAPLAGIGLGRTRLDRGNWAGAAAAVTSVPTGFAYTTYLQPGGVNAGGLSISNVYDYAVEWYNCGYFAPASGKGQNGLNYTTANDPRLVFTTTLYTTCDPQPDTVWYYPVKFGNPSRGVPMATGVEARLIEAEAALHAGQVATWASDLNTLRANAPATYLALAAGVAPLPTDSTTAAPAATQVDVMFRERAFWLFGMGSRLGDMRRLVRQYGRDQATVFPVGSYPGSWAADLPAPLPSYGSDVTLTLPTVSGGLNDPNSNYKGCTSRAA